MNLIKAVSTIGGLTLVSRLFGFVRDVLLARILGASAAADAWQLAFQLPNIFRRLFAEGAFSAAFVPLFNQRLKDDGNREEAERFSNQVLSVFLPVLVVFTIVLELIMPGVIWVIDDFGQGGRTNAFTVSLARITFPYLALISVMTLLAAILNSMGRFAAAAAAPVLLNLCMISALLLGLTLYPQGDPRSTAYLLAFGVALAGLLQMLWLAWFVHRAGFRLMPGRPRLTPGVRQLGVLILPAIFGAGIYQISRFVDLFFLGRLPEGSFVYLAMADRLNQLPLGIIGIALGTAILPALSRFIARDDPGGAQRTQSNAVELAMLVTLPATVALILLSGPLVSAIYVGGLFTDADGLTTASVVSMLVIGLPAYVLIKVLTPGFFAREDTRTPVYTALVALIVNITLNIMLIPIFGVAGLALSGAISAWTNCALLYALLHMRGHFHFEPDLLWRVARIVIAALVMGAVLHFALPYGADYYAGSLIERALSIGALILIGVAVYFPIAWIIGAIDKAKIAMLLGRGGAAKPPATDATP